MKIEPEKDKYNLNRNTDRVSVSRRIDDQSVSPVRIANKVFELPQHACEAFVKDEIVLRISDGGKQSVKATFFEDYGQLKTLTIQRYTYETGKPHEKTSISFWGDQIPKLLEFIMNIKRLNFPHSGSFNVSDHELREMVLSNGQIKRLAIEDEETLIAISEGKVTKRDVVSLAYRKAELKRFRQLLDDPDYLGKGMQKLNLRRVEDLWQWFFERNKWIFGYGLSLISLSALDERQLQQITTGANISQPGKRPDGLMKTRGIINSLCFVEIKRHDTPLLRQVAQPDRPGSWEPSRELTASIAQSQSTVYSSVKSIGERLNVTTTTGEPTGEILYRFDPRAFVVIGSLSEFNTRYGINEDKYKSFELFRRNIRRPEVITFDEIHDRAELILSSHEDHNENT